MAMSNWFRRSARTSRPSKVRRFNPILEFLEDRAVPAVIAVTGGGDNIAVDGVVTLREAIEAANTNAPVGDAPAGDAGLDTIRFNLDPSQQVIQLDTPLIATEPITIDGTSQPGYTDSPLVHLRPSEPMVQGALGINGGDSTVRGLDIEGFPFAAIVLTGPGGDVVTSCQVVFNVTGILIIDSSNNIIGGTAASDANTVFGNQSEGIDISGLDSTGNQVLGNFIGNAAGTTSVGNGIGVLVAGTDNLIGGATSGARNIISGNTTGVEIAGPNNHVEGNFIGVDITGTLPLRNGGDGVVVSANNVTHGNVIGGTVPAARNIISGNGNGVAIIGDGNVVEGNFIGTDVTGEASIGNTQNGVTLVRIANSTVGGIAAGAGNLISGNGGDGVLLRGCTNCVVQGNIIGADALGTSNLGNGGQGIDIDPGTSGNTIGGAVPGAGNVISANIGAGILIHGSGATGNIVQGNVIGTDKSGAGALGNGASGVAISGGAGGNTIGGEDPADKNIIAFNHDNGVTVFIGVGNLITGNAIFANGGLGIDLNNNGVTPNDPGDADTGPNQQQNFPELHSAVIHKGATIIQGSLPVTANTGVYRIEFFTNDAANASGNGEGQTYLGSVSVDSAVSLNFSMSVPIEETGKFITATATDAANNTSEFSAAIAAGHTEQILVVGADAGAVPRVMVFDHSGRPLAGFLVYSPTFRGGVRVAVGDVNGDQVPDIIVAPGAGPAQRIEIIDGTKLDQVQANGRISPAAFLGSFFAYTPAYTSGVFVAAGDVNNDGRADIITGGGNGSRVKVIDAARIRQVLPDGRIAGSALVGNFLAYAPAFQGGVTVAAGDVNGDGKADVITAPAIGSQRVEAVDARRLKRLTSGGRIAPPALLANFFAFGPAFTAGVFVAAADVNGDHRADLIMGAGAGARVKVVDAANVNNVLSNVAVFSASFQGGVRVGTLDVDADGLAEIVVGAGPTHAGLGGLRALDVLHRRIVLDLVFDLDGVFAAGG